MLFKGPSDRLEAHLVISIVVGPRLPDIFRCHIGINPFSSFYGWYSRREFEATAISLSVALQHWSLGCEIDRFRTGSPPAYFSAPDHWDSEKPYFSPVAVSNFLFVRMIRKKSCAIALVTLLKCFIQLSLRSQQLG
jgi:hypothetical protein